MAHEAHLMHEQALKQNGLEQLLLVRVYLSRLWKDPAAL